MKTTILILFLALQKYNKLYLFFYVSMKGCILFRLFQKKKTILTVFLFVSFVSYNSAQSYSYKHYTIFDGLVQNQVSSLYQDRLGFLWIGTKGGVSRFDGITFKNYTINGGLTKGMVIGFGEDSENNLFCFTNYGYSVFKNGNFFPVKLFDDSFINRFYGPIDYSNKSCFYLISSKNIFICNNKGWRVLYTDRNDLKLTGYYQNKATKKEYILTENGIYKFKDGFLKNKLCNLQANQIKHIGNNGYFISCGLINNKPNGTTIYKIKNDSLLIQWHGSNLFFHDEFCCFDENKILFACTDNKWCIVDSLGRIIISDEYNDFVCISAVYQDREGNVWIGTEQGLFRLQSFAFRNYTEDTGLEKYIWSIAETPDGAIWFASFNGGITKIKNEQIEKVAGIEKVLPENNKLYMGGMCDSKGNLLLPTDNSNVISCLPNLHRFFKKNDIEWGSIFFCIYEDTLRNLLMFGSTKGLYIYHYSTGEVEHFGTEEKTIVTIENDKYNRLWICSRIKVLLFDGKKFIKFGDKEIVPGEGINSCKRDNYGNMWLGKEDGLYLYKYDTMYKIFDEPFFFTSLYKKKYLTAGTIKGFYFIDLLKFYSGSAGCFRFYDRYNGFCGKECGQNGSCIDSKGNIWIPTSDRVVKFMPDLIKDNKKSPETYIYSFQVAGNDLKWYQLLNEYNFADTMICLNYDQNNIRFEYHGISFSCPEKVNYKIRLLGYDEKWSDVTSSKIATFTNLDPGNYALEVVACNSDGYWTKDPVRLTFKIMPAFWQTWWFYVVIVVIIIILILLIFKSQISRIKTHAREKQETVQLKLELLQRQLNPHFIDNCLNSVNNLVATNDEVKINNYLSDLSRLMRLSLNNSNMEYIPLKDEVETIQKYLKLEHTNNSDRFDYSIIVYDDLNLSENEIIPSLIQPFVENCIKHAFPNNYNKKGLIKIEFKHGGSKKIICTISDNGIGKNNSIRNKTDFQKQRKSKGEFLVLERLSLFNAVNKADFKIEINDICIPSGVTGTIVKIEIPIKTIAY